MLARAPAARVLGHQPAQPVQGAAGPGDGAAQPVEVAQLAGGDPDQRDEVVGLPEAVDVALAEADAAAQRAAPGGGVVDGDGGAQVGVGRAEAAAAPAFDAPRSARGARRGSSPSRRRRGRARPSRRHEPLRPLPLGVGEVARALQLQPQRLRVDLRHDLQRHRRVAGQQPGQQRPAQLAAAQREGGVEGLAAVLAAGVAGRDSIWTASRSPGSSARKA